MIIKYKTFTVISYIFFLLYFVSYFNFPYNTALKYLSLILYQIIFIFFIKNKNIIYNKKINTIIFLIIFSLIISLILNFNIDALIKTTSLIDLFIFSYFIFPIGIEKSKVTEIELIKIITNSVFLVMLLGFILFYNDIQLSIGRSSGLSIRHIFNCGHASIVGFLCFVEFCLSVYLLKYESKKKIPLIITIVKLFFSIYMAYLADIRSSLVSMIIFTLLYFLYKLPKTKLLFAIKTICVIIFSIFSIFYLNNISLDTNQLNYILSGRLSYYQESLTELKQKNGILFGNGSFRNSSVEGSDKIQVDNSYIDLLYQYGAFTLLFSIVLLIYMIKIIMKNKKISSNKEQINYNSFIKSYFIAVLVYSMVEKNLFSISSAISLVTFILVFWYIRKGDSNMVTKRRCINEKNFVCM